jgi:SNF2-related domain
MTNALGPQPYKPKSYMRKSIKMVVSQAAAGLFLDPGLGKTGIILAAFKVLKFKGIVDKMLVIAPLRVCHSTWPGEIAKWSDFNGLKVVVLHGPRKRELLKSKADVYVINPDGLDWFVEEADPNRWPFQMLVVDESTRFKHDQTQRFRRLRQMLPWFARRYILTGSPAPNGLLDLFGQVFILDFGAALGKYISHYKMNFFDAGGYGMKTFTPRAGAEEAIYAKLRPLVMRLSAEDYLDLEPYVTNTVEVELPAAARHTYDQMEKTLVAAVEEEMVTAANAAAATGKCRQIANGGIYQGLEDQRKALHVHDAKTEAVLDLVEELSGKPALIAYEFDHDRVRLQEAFKKQLGLEVPYIGGGVAVKEFKRLEAAWNMGEVPVLLAQPQSVAHGLNLQGTGAAVIWYALTWDLENYEQLIRRVWRQGQKERVVVHHVIAKGTIDEVIMKTIGKKNHTQQALLEALKDHLKERR